MFPDVRISLALIDRNVDLVDDGLDLAVRIGELPRLQRWRRALAPYGGWSSLRPITCVAAARRESPKI